MELLDTRKDPRNEAPLFPMSESDRERLVRVETEGKDYARRIARLEKVIMSGVGVVIVAVLVAVLALVLLK